MSILKGALERLLAEAQSSRQKELEQVCSTALVQLLQQIDVISKENEANLKNKQNVTKNSDASNITSERVSGEASEKEGKTKSNLSPGKSIENASPSLLSGGSGRA